MGPHPRKLLGGARLQPGLLTVASAPVMMVPAPVRCVPSPGITRVAAPRGAGTHPVALGMQTDASFYSQVAGRASSSVETRGRASCVPALWATSCRRTACPVRVSAQRGILAGEHMLGYTQGALINEHMLGSTHLRALIREYRPGNTLWGAHMEDTCNPEPNS